MNSAHSLARFAVGHVAADENEIERLGDIDRFEAGHDAHDAAVTAWPAPPTFDAESVMLTHHVEIGKMRDAPRRAGGCCSECGKVDRLVHARIGETPDEGNDR